MTIFESLDYICKQLATVWTWLNTPTISLYGVGGNIFPLFFPKDIINAIAPTPLSMFMVGFLVLLTVSFIFRFIRLLNPLT